MGGEEEEENYFIGCAKMLNGYEIFRTQLIDDPDWFSDDKAEIESLQGSGYRVIFNQLMIFEGKPFLITVLDRRPEYVPKSVDRSADKIFDTVTNTNTGV